MAMTIPAKDPIASKRRRTVPAPPPPDKATGITLWRQVADDLERAIAAGTYRAGAKLPGENEIAEQFQVNRHTVRRALATLIERGLVRAERGSGTYVENRRIAYPIGARTRFSDIVSTSGREAGGRLLASSVEPATEETAKELRIKPGTHVIRLEHLRQADGFPICLATSFLPAARFPAAAQIYAARRSITRMLAHFGVRDYRRARTWVVAALADAADAMRLELRPGAPILVVDSVDVDAEGQPVLISHTRFAGERVAFVVNS
jgi:GntR family phosphonate transport system transcriptional regulator